MKMNPADKPKAIILAVLIVLIGGFGLINFMGKKGPAPTPPGPAADPNANLPTAKMLADGKTRPDSVAPKVEDLASVFTSTDTTAMAVNPFRSPAPAPKAGVATQPPPARPVTAYQPPPLGSGSNVPLKPFGEGGIGGGPAPMVQSTEPMFVKGIIAPPDGEESGMAFIKVGNTSRGFRVGDIVTSGVRVTSISTGTVTVKIGAKTVTASVGQQIKLFEPTP